MSTNPSDYLYDRMGPWPQPNPAMDLWAAVVHLPKDELRRYQWNIGLRYMSQLVLYTPAALWYAWTNPGLAPLDDAEFADRMCVRAFSKFLYQAKRGDIETFLPGFELNRLNPDRQYFISDLYLMRHIPPQDGMYTAVTVALFEKESPGADRFRPVAIFVESAQESEKKAQTVVYPENGDAWELAKYYTMMGCAYRIVFSLHSTLHFPMDALNAITKTALPKSNTVFQLLLPHLEFSLELDFGVQTSHRSPIKNHQEYLYTGVTGTADQIAGLFEDAHRGVPGRYTAYPPFHFSMVPVSESNSEYFRFQMAYYHCIKRFVDKVVDRLSDEDKKQLQPWAGYIAPFINRHIQLAEFSAFNEHPLNHFPYAHEIFGEHEGEPLLNLLLTMIIWDLTVGHAGDHYDFGMMDMASMPMRMRVPAPASRHIPPVDRKKLRTFVDTYKHRMEWRMFYMPTNVSLLYNTDYGFTDPVLQQYNREFLEDLKETEKSLAGQGIRNFLPLKQIARSIQY